jgi:hypothetical protein
MKDSGLGNRDEGSWVASAKWWKDNTTVKLLLPNLFCALLF